MRKNTMSGFARRNRGGLYLVRPGRAGAAGKERKERAGNLAGQSTETCLKMAAGHDRVRTATCMQAARLSRQATAKPRPNRVFTYRLQWLAWLATVVTPQTRRMRCDTP